MEVSVLGLLELIRPMFKPFRRHSCIEVNGHRRKHNAAMARGSPGSIKLILTAASDL